MTQVETPGVSLLSKRILLVTGKGGVGKTTVVAALARYAASLGRRVLALDVERAFETPSTLLSYLGGGQRFSRDEPVVLTSQLSCARLSATAGHQVFLEDQLPFRWLAKAAVSSKHLNRFLTMAPGFQELGILYRGMPYLRAKRSDGSYLYEHVIVDLPATGHALALTSIPGPMLDVFENGPVATSIREAQGFFNDSTQTGSVVVSLPEPLVISETLELLEGLKRDDVQPSGVVVNRLPTSPLSGDARKELLGIFGQIDEPLLGSWSLQRMDSALEAFHQLRATMEERAPGASLVSLEEDQFDGPQACVNALAEQFGRAVSSPEPTAI